jgi:hypothetical protein
VLELFYKLPISFYLALLVPFLTCLLIFKTRRWHRIFTLDSSEGVQKLHKEPTPRIFVWEFAQEHQLLFHNLSALKPMVNQAAR